MRAAAPSEKWSYVHWRLRAKLVSLHDSTCAGRKVSLARPAQRTPEVANRPAPLRENRDAAPANDATDARRSMRMAMKAQAISRLRIHRLPNYLMNSIS